jgi:hypothetical protein
MQIINLYKYTREDGGTTVSPIKPNTEYTEMYRLVADDGKVLTKDGENFTTCIDTDTADGWYEVDDPESEATGEDYQSAIEDLGVNFNE